jgi:hypothetical protein
MLLALLLQVKVEKIDYIDGSPRSSRLTDQPPREIRTFVDSIGVFARMTEQHL